MTDNKARPSRPKLTLDQRQRAIDAAGTIQQLLTYDDLWTSHLKEAQSQEHIDVTALQAVAERLDSLWSDVAPAANQLRSIVADNPEALSETYDYYMTSDRLGQRYKEEWATRVREAGGISELVANDLTQLAEGAEEERRSIADKMAMIQRGEFTRGDMEDRRYCYGWAALSVGFGIAGSIPSPLSPVFWAWGFMAAATAGYACGGPLEDLVWNLKTYRDIAVYVHLRTAIALPEYLPFPLLNAPGTPRRINVMQSEQPSLHVRACPIRTNLRTQDPVPRAMLEGLD